MIKCCKKYFTEEDLPKTHKIKGKRVCACRIIGIFYVTSILMYVSVFLIIDKKHLSIKTPQGTVRASLRKVCFFFKQF